MKYTRLRTLLASIAIFPATAPFASHADVMTHDEQDTFITEISDLIPSEPLRPLNARVVTGADRALYGTWGPVIPFPHIPVSAANLPDGRVVTFASNERNRFPRGPEFTYAATYDPSGTGAPVEVNHDAHDMFCGNLVMLGDGRPFITGGRNDSPLTSTFDWRTNEWELQSELNFGRWYPTTTLISENTVVVTAGRGGPDIVEIGSPNGFQVLSNIDWDQATTFPINFLAPNGKLIYAGPTEDLYWIDISGNGSHTPAGASLLGDHNPNNTPVVMYRKGKLLGVGGNVRGVSGSTDLAFTVDVNGATPIVESVSPMIHKRKFGSGVMLPNGRFFIAGGNTSGVAFSDDGAVLETEEWDPDTDTWNPLADVTVPRGYHSVGLLLSDGRVFFAGGGLNGTASHNHPDAQVYSPYYLYNSNGGLASRPEITNTSATLLRRGTKMTVSATGNIQRFTLTRLTAITHHRSTDYRFLEVPFVNLGDGTYELDLEENPNVLTDGYWFLWALDNNGIPSPSKTLKAQSNDTGIDIQNITMASSGNNVEVTYTNVGSIQLNSGWMLFMDTDSNTSTGYQAYGRGGDYLLRNHQIFEYTGSGTNWSWQYVGTTETNVNGNVATFTFPESWLGNAGLVQAIFYGDNSAFGQSGSSVYPPLGSGESIILNLGGTITLEGIPIDANLNDWPDADMFGQDPDDVSGVANAIDLRQLYAYLGNQHLFLFWVNDTPIQLNDGWMLFFDTDQNPDTGYRAWGVGGDYMLRNRTVYRYTGNGTNWSWATQGTATVETNNQYMEAGFPLSWIGNDQNFSVLFYGNNSTYVGGSGFDLFPDNGSGTPVPGTGNNGGNLAANPGFENGFDDWGDWGDNSYSLASNARSGSRSMAIGPTEGGSWQQIDDINPGDTLNVSVWAYRTNINTNCTLGVFFDNAQGNSILSKTTPITSANYSQVSISETAPAGTTSARIWMWKGTNANWLIVDDVSVTK